MYLHGSRGDIVLVPFPFREKDGRSKPRPALIIREDCADEYYLCEITTTNRSDKLKGKWIIANSAEGMQIGINEDSFINYENRTLLNKKFVFKKIGTYPFMDELEKYLESLGENT